MLSMYSQPCIMQSLCLYYTCVPILLFRKSSIQSYTEYLEGSQSLLIVYGYADRCIMIIFIIPPHRQKLCTLLEIEQQFLSLLILYTACRYPALMMQIRLLSLSGLFASAVWLFTSFFTQDCPIQKVADLLWAVFQALMAADSVLFSEGIIKSV